VRQRRRIRAEVVGDVIGDLRGNRAATVRRGRGEHGGPRETQLTPNEAAELLGISRPFLLDLMTRGRLAAGALPESRHRIVRLADVLEFQAEGERRGQTKLAIAEIVEIVEDENLPY
jgi:excisionase family DNA binding protein